MSSIVESLTFIWNKNLAYGQKLIADLYQEQMILQPGPEVNHPAWVFCHLNTYLPIIQAICREETYPDPKDSPYGMNSHPQADASLYPGKEELLNEFVKGHEEAEKALRSAPASMLEKDISLGRWKDSMKINLTILTYLMSLHENLHLGQLSAWRRVQGLPRV